MMGKAKTKESNIARTFLLSAATLCCPKVQGVKPVGFPFALDIGKFGKLKEIDLGQVMCS